MYISLAKWCSYAIAILTFGLSVLAAVVNPDMVVSGRFREQAILWTLMAIFWTLQEKR